MQAILQPSKDSAVYPRDEEEDQRKDMSAESDTRVRGIIRHQAAQLYRNEKDQQ